MARSWNDDLEKKAVADDLEPYRRLVELQRQMIELAEQHEEAKRRRDELHEQMVREAALQRPGRHGLRHRLQQSAARLLRQVPGWPVEDAANHTRQPKWLWAQKDTQ